MLSALCDAYIMCLLVFLWLCFGLNTIYRLWLGLSRIIWPEQKSGDFIGPEQKSLAFIGTEQNTLAFVGF